MNNRYSNTIDSTKECKPEQKKALTKAEEEKKAKERERDEKRKKKKKKRVVWKIF